MSNEQSLTPLKRRGCLQRLHETLLVRQLSKIQQGFIRLETPTGQYKFGEQQAELSVVIVVEDETFFESVVTGGTVGAAESYMAGDWQCDDLTGLVRILVLNRDIMDSMEGGLAAMANSALKILHWFNRNTRSGSQRNISAHYDLGNDLFELFLDRDWMMYSSALYFDGRETLEDAQAQKLARLCDMLDLRPDDHLLEIGTGWGGCAVFAAQHYGCRVTTTTISREQYDFAVARVKKAGLEQRITILLEDYRDLTGVYDKLISIEMVEAVGHHFIDDYFRHCSHLLKNDGLAVLQAITIEDHRYLQSLKTVDFIKRYIFPGSFIPCVSRLTAAAGQAELRLVELTDIGESYAITLQQWRQRFMEQLDSVREQGYSEAFIRMWEFYLCYCEGGFRERSISDVHMLFAKPGNRMPQRVLRYA